MSLEVQELNLANIVATIIPGIIFQRAWVAGKSLGIESEQYYDCYISYEMGLENAKELISKLAGVKLEGEPLFSITEDTHLLQNTEQENKHSICIEVNKINLKLQAFLNALNMHDENSKPAYPMQSPKP